MFFVRISFFLKSRAQLQVEELQPLLKENREYFLATKALACAASVSSRGSSRNPGQEQKKN